MIAATFFALLCLASVLLAWIDLRYGIIPDWLNLSIAVIGLARAIVLDGWEAALGVGCEGIAVGAIAWLLRRLYFMFRKYQGLGLGDVKLLAASGDLDRPRRRSGAAPGRIVGRVGGGRSSCTSQGRTMTRQTSLPFGPFLALGLLVTLVLQQSRLDRLAPATTLRREQPRPASPHSQPLHAPARA